MHVFHARARARICKICFLCGPPWRKVPHTYIYIWVTSLIRGLGIGHLSKTEGSQRNLPKSIAFCCQKAVPKKRLFGYFESPLRLMILTLSICLDLFWQSLSLVQLTAKSFTKASRKLHELMLPTHSPWWKILWEWISNGCLWISMDFLWISMDFLWISFDFLWFPSFCIGKHNDLEWIAHFALVFAGIARYSNEIHSVFKQKMITKWANKSKSEIALSMSDLLHTPY